MMKPETPPEVKMELKDDAPEKMKAMVPELFTTLSAEFVDISHTFEDDKLTIEFTMKDKDTIIAALAAKVREGASVKTCSLEFVLTACLCCALRFPRRSRKLKLIWSRARSRYNTSSAST